jgi:hypothetical protein
MNGRIYDYNLGRFMSVDPFIQMPESSQSINPYSYLMNNPMAGTDPAGYLKVCDTFVVCGPDRVEDSFNTLINLGGSETSNGGSSDSQKSSTANQETTEIGIQANIAQDTSSSVSNTGTSTNGKSAGFFEKAINFIAPGVGWGFVSDEEASQANADRFGGIGLGCKAEGNCLSDGQLQNMSSVAGLVGTVSPSNLVVAATNKTLLRTAIQIKPNTVADEIIQNVARTQNSLGFKHLRKFMSDKEINAYLADPLIGHAVHRATASTLQRLYPGRFDYNATRKFDFIDKKYGQAVELTTRK